MRVLVADDSAFMRRAISQMLESDAAIEVVATARNGREAVELAKKLSPDVVTLDIEMPEMDGLTALRHLKRNCSCRVLMLSSLSTEGSRVALRAMAQGADDVMAKDSSQISLSIGNIKDGLIERVKALAAARPAPPEAVSRDARRSDPIPSFKQSQFDVILIGSSTGGPPVLERILRALPATLTTPIVIAQHMPRLFTCSMAERLDAMCALPVCHIEDGMPLAPACVYVAPGEVHTKLEKQGFRRWRLCTGPEPRDALYRPSVDALFASAAEAVGERALAIVLTGMGQDGFAGAKLLHAAGASLIAQTQESCVVYGMPKGITENALVVASLDPDGIGQTLARLGPTSKAAAIPRRASA